MIQIESNLRTFSGRYQNLNIQYKIKFNGFYYGISLSFVQPQTHSKPHKEFRKVFVIKINYKILYILINRMARRKAYWTINRIPTVRPRSLFSSSISREYDYLCEHERSHETLPTACFLKIDCFQMLIKSWLCQQVNK